MTPQGSRKIEVARSLAAIPSQVRETPREDKSKISKLLWGTAKGLGITALLATAIGGGLYFGSPETFKSVQEMLQKWFADIGSSGTLKSAKEMFEKGRKGIVDTAAGIASSETLRPAREAFDGFSVKALEWWENIKKYVGGAAPVAAVTPVPVQPLDSLGGAAAGSIGAGAAGEAADGAAGAAAGAAGSIVPESPVSEATPARPSLSQAPQSNVIGQENLSEGMKKHYEQMAKGQSAVQEKLNTDIQSSAIGRGSTATGSTDISVPRSNPAAPQWRPVREINGGTVTGGPGL